MTLDVQGDQDKRLLKDPAGKETKEGGGGAGPEWGDNLDEQYESKMSKVSGATDFTILSDFSEVNKVEKKLKW